MRRFPFRFCLLLFLLSTTFIQCYRMRKSSGGGQIESIPQRTVNAADVALHPGYKIELVTTSLTFPTAAVTDDEGKLYVIVAGYSYGEVFGEPRLFRLENNGAETLLATGTKNGHWTGITFYDWAFYIAENSKPVSALQRN